METSFVTLDSKFAMIHAIVLALSTSCFPYILGIIQIISYFFVGCSRGIRNLNLSGAMTFRPLVKFSGMDLYCEFYDGRQGLGT